MIFLYPASIALFKKPIKFEVLPDWTLPTINPLVSQAPSLKDSQYYSSLSVVLSKLIQHLARTVYHFLNIHDKFPNMVYLHSCHTNQCDHSHFLLQNQNFYSDSFIIVKLDLSLWKIFSYTKKSIASTEILHFQLICPQFSVSILIERH